VLFNDLPGAKSLLNPRVRLYPPSVTPPYTPVTTGPEKPLFSGGNHYKNPLRNSPKTLGTKVSTQGTPSKGAPIPKPLGNCRKPSLILAGTRKMSLKTTRGQIPPPRYPKLNRPSREYESPSAKKNWVLKALALNLDPRGPIQSKWEETKCQLCLA